jgi:hypothetical protein
MGFLVLLTTLGMNRQGPAIDGDLDVLWGARSLPAL